MNKKVPDRQKGKGNEIEDTAPHITARQKDASTRIFGVKVGVKITHELVKRVNSAVKRPPL